MQHIHGLLCIMLQKNLILRNTFTTIAIAQVIIIQEVKINGQLRAKVRVIGGYPIIPILQLVLTMKAIKAFKEEMVYLYLWIKSNKTTLI